MCQCFSAFIDITDACQADVGQLVTGEATLIFEIVPGQNSQVKGQWYSNRENRMYETLINANCGSGMCYIFLNPALIYCIYAGIPQHLESLQNLEK